MTVNGMTANPLGLAVFKKVILDMPTFEATQEELDELTQLANSISKYVLESNEEGCEECKFEYANCISGGDSPMQKILCDTRLLNCIIRNDC